MTRLGAFAVVVGVLGIAGDAIAQNHLVVEGVLRDNAGAALDGSFDITYALYADEDAADPLWSETHVGQTVAKGFFQSRLGESQSLAPQLFADNAGMWLGIALAGQPELPRTPLETDPYAFRAGIAEVAKTADSADTAKSVSCTGCIELTALNAAVLTAINIAYDDSTTKLGATTVAGAIAKLKALIAAGGGGGGGAKEGNGVVASSNINEWALQPFAVVKDYIHLFNPITPKVLMHVYGDTDSSFATGNNLVVAYDFAPNQYSHAVQGQAGDVVIQVGNPSAFTPGSHILLYQTVGTNGNGTGAGNWELNGVKSVEGSTVQLVKPLKNTYVDNGNNSGRSQAVVAASYNNLEIVSGGILRPSKLLDVDGKSGGITYVRSQTVTVHAGGRIHADWAGFDAQNSSQDAGDSECNTQPNNSSSGNNNCSGGGGGTSSYCTGGGGGNKTAGKDQTQQGNCNNSHRGKGGTAKGDANATVLTMGGAGGQADGNNCSSSYASGGGLVVIGASVLTVKPGGQISANGRGHNTWGCGGGAGGSVAIFADTVVNEGTVEAKGAPGAPKPNNSYADAGDGGEGWVHIKDVIPGVVNESYPKGVQIWIDGVNVTPTVGDPNGKGSPAFNATNSTWGADGLSPWSTGPLDLTNVANWTLGEHKIELNETGGAGGQLKSYIYVIYPFTNSVPPANDTCTSPVKIDLSGGPAVLSGTTEDIMGKTKGTDSSQAAGCGGIGGPDVMYEIELTERSLINATVVAPFSSKLYVRKDSCKDGEVVFCADKDLVTTPLEAGKYFLVVDSDSPQAKGNFSLAVSLTPAPLPQNDTCDTATELVFANGKATHSGTNKYALDDEKGLCSQALTGGPDVVYKFSAGAGQILNATLDATFDTIMYVTTVGCGKKGVPLSCSASGTLTIQGLAGGDYWLVVDGTKEKEWGTYDLTLQLSN